MKVKIGNTIYTSKEQPIMVILTEKDKFNISHMHPNATKYCEFTEGMDQEEIEKWMDEDEQIYR